MLDIRSNQFQCATASARVLYTCHVILVITLQRSYKLICGFIQCVNQLILYIVFRSLIIDCLCYSIVSINWRPLNTDGK